MSSENLFLPRFSWTNGENVLCPSTNIFSKPKTSYLYKRSRGESINYIPLSKQFYNDSHNSALKSKENHKKDSHKKPEETPSQVLRSRLKEFRPGSHYKHRYFNPVTPDLPKEVSVKKNKGSFNSDTALKRKSRRKSHLSYLPTPSNHLDSSHPLLSKLLDLRKNFSVKPVETFRPKVLRIIPKRVDELRIPKGRSMSPAAAYTHKPCPPGLFLTTVDSNSSLSTAVTESGSESITIKGCPTIVKYRSMSVPRRPYLKSGVGMSMETQTERNEGFEREHDATMNFNISEGESAEEESPGIRYTAKYSQYN